MKNLLLAFALLFAAFSLACPAYAQTPAPEPTATTQSWSANVSGVALPGGKTSFAGVDSGIGFQPSADFGISERNLLSSDGSLKYFGGGFQITVPQLSVATNNLASNVNFLRVRFIPEGSFGVVLANGREHYGFTAGLRIEYMLTKTGSWTIGGKGEYLHFPGYPGHSLVELPVSFHF